MSTIIHANDKPVGIVSGGGGFSVATSDNIVPRAEDTRSRAHAGTNIASKRQDDNVNNYTGVSIPTKNVNHIVTTGESLWGRAESNGHEGGKGQGDMPPIPSNPRHNALKVDTSKATTASDPSNQMRQDIRNTGTVDPVGFASASSGVPRELHLSPSAYQRQQADNQHNNNNNNNYYDNHDRRRQSSFKRHPFTSEPAVALVAERSCCRRCRCRCYIMDKATRHFLRVEIALLITGALLVGAGFAVERWIPDEEVVGMPVWSALLLLAYFVALGVPGRFLNWFTYFMFDRCCRAKLLTTFAYYATTLDGPLGNIFAVIVMWATFRKIAPVNDPTRLNQILGFLLIYFILTAVQSIVLRAALAGVIQTAFRKKVEAVDFRRRALLALTHPLTLKQRVQRLRGMQPRAPQIPVVPAKEDAVLYGIVPGGVRQRSDGATTGAQVVAASRLSSTGTAGAVPRSPLPNNAAFNAAYIIGGVAGVDEGYLVDEDTDSSDSPFSTQDFRRHLISVEHSEFKLFDPQGKLVPIYRLDNLRELARATFDRLLRLDTSEDAYQDTDEEEEELTWEEMQEEMQRKLQHKRRMQTLREVATSVVPAALAEGLPEISEVAMQDLETLDSSRSQPSPIDVAVVDGGPQGPPSSSPIPIAAHHAVPIAAHHAASFSSPPSARIGEDFKSPLGRPASVRRSELSIALDAPESTVSQPASTANIAWERFASKAHTYGSLRGPGGIELPAFRRASQADLPAAPRILPTADDTADKVTFDHLRIQIGRAAADALVPLMDIGATSDYTRYEFCRLFQLVFEEWLGLRNTLQGHQSVSSAIRILADIVFYSIMFIVCLLIFNINIIESFVAIAAILVPTSFAFQGPVSNVINSITFIVGQRPFDVGDWVAIDLDTLPNNEYMKVVEINLLACVLETLTGRRVQLPNSLLMTVPIENHSRTDNATFIMLFHVGINTTPAQFSSLSDRLLAYMKSKPLEWKPDLCSYYNYGNYERGVIELEFWTTHQLPWSEIDAVFASQSDIIMTILDIMNSLDIAYRKPTQPVAFHTTLHAGIRGQIGVQRGGTDSADRSGFEDASAAPDTADDTDFISDVLSNVDRSRSRRKVKNFSVSLAAGIPTLRLRRPQKRSAGSASDIMSTPSHKSTS